MAKNEPSERVGWSDKTIHRRGFLLTLGMSGSILRKAKAGMRPGPRPVPQNKPPNIILILADDMGYGDPGCYNKDSLIPTPNIDRIAGEGVRFTDAHSPSALCSPTRYGLLTGRYAWRTRLQKGVLLSYDPPLIEPARKTVASLLRGAGYATAWIGKWHVGLHWETKDGSPAEEAIDRESPVKTRAERQWNVDFAKPVLGGPISLGFDYFYGTAGCSTSDPPYCFMEQDRTVVVPTRLSREEWNGLPGFVPGPMADDWSEEDCDFILTRKAIEYIDRHAEGHPEKPFFLVHALSSPHNPWLVPESMKGKSREGPRGDLVAVVDWAVGAIADHLEKRGLANDTLLIVTSDNGPMRGSSGHKSAGDLRGFKAQIWEGGHRVPFVARWPGRVRPGTVSTETISLIDLAATFAALTGVPLPDDAAEDSRDILPAILGRSGGRPLHDGLVFDSGNGEFALRRGRWKAIEGRGEEAGRLYDLDSDPGEQADLWDKHSDVAASMMGLLKKYRAEGRSRPLQFQ